MSKSYNNAIYLSDTPEDITSKVATMITDPQRARKADPGNPDVCNVFAFHQTYSDRETINRINTECRSAQIGCVECKKLMGANLVRVLEPIREKRAYYVARPEQVDEIIQEGNRKALTVAEQTMAEVRTALNI